MTHILLSLMLATKKPTTDYSKLLNAQQQIINDLNAENKVLKDVLFGPVGSTAYPRWVEEKPTCPVEGFQLQWIVKENEFKPLCVRIK